MIKERGLKLAGPRNQKSPILIILCGSLKIVDFWFWIAIDFPENGHFVNFVDPETHENGVWDR